MLKRTVLMMKCTSPTEIFTGPPVLPGVAQGHLSRSRTSKGHGHAKSSKESTTTMNEILRAAVRYRVHGSGRIGPRRMLSQPHTTIGSR